MVVHYNEIISLIETLPMIFIHSIGITFSSEWEGKLFSDEMHRIDSLGVPFCAE